MLFRTDDPVADAERYASEQEAALELLPVCTICNEHIQDYFCYEINDEIICEHCMNEYFRHETTDFIG